MSVAEIVVRGRRGAVGFGEPKSAAGRRTLAIPVELMDMLTAHMAARSLAVSDPDGLLFTAPDGGVLRYSNWLRRVWYPAAVGAGLGCMVEDASGKTMYVGLGFHDLRRANATGLVAAGIDVKTAQSLLGHSDSRLTLDHYAQAVTELGAAAAEAMGKRFLNTAPRDGRAIDQGATGNGRSAENDTEGL